MLATLEGDRNVLGCCLGADLPQATGFSPQIANVSEYNFSNYRTFSPNELNGLKLKFKAPRAPKFKFKPKIPKVKAFKAPKIKIKVKGPNLSKAAGNFLKPFEDIGRSASGLIQSGFQAPQDLLSSATGLVSNVADSATGLVQDVASAAGQMAPELIKGGLNALAPGAGSLLDMFTGGSPATAVGPSPEYQTAVAASDAVNQIPPTPNVTTDKPNYVLYGALGLAGLAVIYAISTSGKKGK